MKISIIIPTLNGEKYMPELLASLASQSVKPDEIIVIDSSSDDRTAEIATAFGCKVTIIKRSKFDHGGTRNLGVSLSSGDVVVFMTQDALPTTDKFVGNLVRPLLNNVKIGATFGRQLARPDAAPPEQFTRLFNYPEHRMVKSKADIAALGVRAFFFSDVSSAIRRKNFEEAGRFPERILSNEDMVFAARLLLDGYEIAYTPDAVVWHSHNYGVKQQFKRYFDIGVFFSMNNWLKEHGKAESEGAKFVKAQLAYLVKNGQYAWVPQALALNFAKLAGYKLGLMQDRLPKVLKARFSQQRLFWT